MEGSAALSLPGGAIGINDAEDTNHKKAYIAHELGHHLAAGFYNICTPLEIRGRYEYRANKWAFRFMLPYCELMQAVQHGFTEVWQIAEHFDLPEDFIAEAIAYYQKQQQPTVQEVLT